MTENVSLEDLTTREEDMATVATAKTGAPGKYSHCIFFINITELVQ